MTDADKKLENTKKTTKKDAPNQKATSAIKPDSEVTSTSVGIYILIFIIVIAAAAGFYYLWQQQQDLTVKQRNFSEQIAQKIDVETKSLKQQQLIIAQESKDQIKKLYSDQANLHNNLTKLIKDNTQLRKDWLMAETEYLIQLANHRLLLEKDVTTAIVALESADKRLAEISDPALLKVRNIIAKDIQKLNNIQVVDLAGMSVTISALSDNITNLPLNTPEPKNRKSIATEKTQENSDVKNIKDLPAAIWRDIKGLVVIRNHQKPIQPLLSSSQHFFLTQNLALLFEQTRLALLNGQNVIFQERLETTKKWISQYFDMEHNITRNMLSSIAELQKNDIAPILPDISAAFSAIKNYRLHGQQPIDTKVK